MYPSSGYDLNNPTPSTESDTTQDHEPGGRGARYPESAMSSSEIPAESFILKLDFVLSDKTFVRSRLRRYT